LSLYHIGHYFVCNYSIATGGWGSKNIKVKLFFSFWKFAFLKPHIGSDFHFERRVFDSSFNF